MTTQSPQQPLVSPDGQWSWTGAEWIPVEQNVLPAASAFLVTASLSAGPSVLPAELSTVKGVRRRLGKRAERIAIGGLLSLVAAIGFGAYRGWQGSRNVQRVNDCNAANLSSGDDVSCASANTSVAAVTRSAIAAMKMQDAARYTTLAIGHEVDGELTWSGQCVLSEGKTQWVCDIDAVDANHLTPDGTQHWTVTAIAAQEGVLEWKTVPNGALVPPTSG